MTQSNYIKRLEKFVEKVDLTLANLSPEDSPQYEGALGGKNTILKREIDFLKTHKITD